MEPSAITSANWADLGHLLSTLWGVVALIVFFAANLLIGHVWMPSFIRSGHIPASLNKMRPMFYLVAIASFTGAMVLLGFVAKHAGVLREIFESYWI
ncbi:MAG: hypothetical protein FJ317_02985 [SAR202 cluster bacterium]|nr:hypothetical protein [SAR202 cluster bacterium]